MSAEVDQLEGQRLLRHGTGAVRLRRDVVRATGPDAVSYLQGQLSQDLAGLQVGMPVHALVLEPGGKVDAWMRVWSLGDEELLLDVDLGAGEALLQRLQRFRLRVQVELEPATWQMVALRGVATPPAEQLHGAAPLVAASGWPGVHGVDLLGEQVEVPAGVPEVDAGALDVLRIEAGWPAMGQELGPDLDPLVIPAEAGQWLVDASVSFTKGCYTGQELVARVDSRGSNTPRKLRGIVLHGLDAGTLPPTGAEVVVQDQVRGSLSSVGWSAELGAAVALGYVHRSVEPGGAAAVRWAGTAGDAGAVERPAEVRALPLVGG